MTADLQQFVYQGEIGRGAMAIVWRGWDSKLERVVAVKEPLIPAGTDPQRASEMASRFVVEGKVAARLSHPGLVAIYDADVWDGRAAIIMEYVEGETLSNLIDRAPLPVPSALMVLDQLLDAVAYAHAAGVIHRDVKPDNVFVTPAGRIKLSDFGVARVTGGKRLTQAGTIVGTPGYMPPEQILGRPIDARADLFSIGVIAYEMLLGGNPFGATDGVPPTDIMRRIVHEDPPPLYGRLDGVSVELQAALDRSLAKAAGDRFASAYEMLEAFRACANGSAILAVGVALPMPAPGPVLEADYAPAPAAPELQAGSWEQSDLLQAAGLESGGTDESQSYWLIGGGAAAVVLALVCFAMGAVIIGLGVIVAAVVVLVVLMMRRQAESEPAPVEAAAFTPDYSDEWLGDAGAGATLRCAVSGPGDSRGMIVTLPARIGRGADAEVPLMDEQASRYHARLFLHDGRIWVEDLGSRNGTYLDGQYVQGQAPVSLGQRLSIGMTTIDVFEEVST